MTADADAPDVAMAPVNTDDRDRHQLLMHIAVANPTDADELSRRLARPKRAVHDDIKALMRDGIVYVHAGTLRTTQAARLIAEASAVQVREIHDQVLAEAVAQDAPRPSSLVALVDSGCTDAVLLDLLIRAHADNASDAAVGNAVTQLARAHQLSQEHVILLRARDAATHGSAHRVIALTDSLIVTDRGALSRQAAVLAAGAHIRGNRLDRAAALLAHVGHEHIHHDAVWAVVAAVGRGDLAAATTWVADTRDDSLTSLSAGLAEFAEALVLSVHGNGDGSIDLLARSVQTLAPLGGGIILPETPAAIAAILAIGRGEPQLAEDFLERALAAGLGGKTTRMRHSLLLAWALMVQGNLAAAETIANEVSEPHALGERERLLYWCLRVGISRRRADTAAMREIWREIRSHTFGMTVTLFDLLPIGEMMLTAARLREQARVRDVVDSAVALLTRLGDPVAWSALFHWHAVQAAFQSQDTAMLLAPANALAAAAALSPYAETLARAGHTWLEMLRDETDYASVEASARALAAHGHTWDAARLAGQAALQHPEREGALAMMQLAREIDKDHARQTRTAPQSTSLTAREVDVARLVLDGHGYRTIGEQLFISPKTVEHHVARIRGRLGATSRGELLEMLHTEIAKLE